jgi:hypothetical protein
MLDERTFCTLVDGLRTSLKQDNAILDSLEEYGISINLDRHIDYFWNAVDNIMANNFTGWDSEMIMDFICDGYIKAQDKSRDKYKEMTLIDTSAMLYDFLTGEADNKPTVNKESYFDFD